MTILGHKYNIDDTAYAVQVTTGDVQVPCPDCLGTRGWHAVLPSGEEMEIKCPTCTFGYEARGTVPEFTVTYEVQRLTIGSVRVDTKGWRDGVVSYMCVETGVGSGSIYYEKNLYSTFEEANEAGPSRMDEQRRAIEEANARNSGRRTTKHRIGKRVDEAGRMGTFYRARIREGKKMINDGERGLARESAGKEVK